MATASTPGSTTTNTPATTTSNVGQQIGAESSLSNWAGPYVTEMLGRGQAIASQPYQAYTGPLTAGESALQRQAFQGLASLAIPTAAQTTYTPGQFTAEDAQRLMNPYLQAALDPQIAEARRQAEIQNLANRTAATKAGAYGGGRFALMESENQRNLLQNLAGITGTGYKSAYDQAVQQFNAEQQRQQQATQMAQQYGLSALQQQANLGAQQRAIEQEGVMADLGQFREERDFPYKQVQYMQSLLQNLPLQAQSYSYAQPSLLSQVGQGAAGLGELARIFGGTGAATGTTAPTNTTTTPPATTTPAASTPAVTPPATTSPGTTDTGSSGVTR